MRGTIGSIFTEAEILAFLTKSLGSRKNGASVLSITSIKRPQEGCAGYSDHPFEKEAHERGMSAPSLSTRVVCCEQKTRRRSRETDQRSK